MLRSPLVSPGKTLCSLALAAVLMTGLSACSDSEEPAPDSTNKDSIDKAASDQKIGKRDGPAVVAVIPRQPEIPITKAAVHGRLESAVMGAHRSAEERARDAYRHPVETLTFFGLDRGTRVLEVSPGSGWYAALIAPVVNSIGKYMAAIPDEKQPGQPEYYAALNQQFEARVRAHPRVYGTPPSIRRYNADQPNFGAAGSVDMVLSFRNAHNWVSNGSAPAYFKGFYDVLKPGGTLGIVDHRAAPGAATDGSTGYVTEQQIIDLATAAGFRLEAKSEVNANPKDTKDYPDGVWTLPPTYALKDVDRERYAEIGESDRMTLKFVK